MAGQEAQQAKSPGSAQEQMRTIDVSNDSPRPLQKGGNKLLQPQAGVSSTVCLDNFPHQTPISFSLLQLSWLQHQSRLAVQKVPSDN